LKFLPPGKLPQNDFLAIKKNRREKMKIKIEFTVDVDPEAWELNYGTGRNEIRNDVKGYVENIVFGQLDVVGVLAEGGE
tara:strand:+ start:293 stop:529 length:237 start_codon:yes stop_codon:yes gene_type:complete